MPVKPLEQAAGARRIRRHGWAALLSALAGCGYFRPVTTTLARGTAAASASSMAPSVLYAGGDAQEASVDQGGNVWIATQSGVRCFTPGGLRSFNHAADGLTTDQVRTAAGGRSGEALVGFGPQGVPGQDNPAQLNYLTLSGTGVDVEDYHFNLTTEIVQANHAVYDPARNQFWIGTNEGISLFDSARDVLEHRHPVHPHGFTNGVAITAYGDVWDGDEFQLSKLNSGPQATFDGPFNPVLKPLPLDQQNFSALSLDAQERVWAGSLSQGLALVDGQALTAQLWTLEAGLPSLAVQAVAVDPDGSVWVGTADEGLGRLEPSSGSWQVYDSTSGLGSNEVRSLFVDRTSSPRRLVITTGAGVESYDGP
jgi:ligand-binding sensor domain-containing protein